jgi:diguanylate cyclase (GGDEF)-like protein
MDDRPGDEAPTADAGQQLGLGRLFDGPQRALAAVVVVLLLLTIVQAARTSQSSVEAVDATTGAQTTTSIIGFTQRESLGTAVEVERWLGGTASRRDLQIARALLARRLATVDETGTSAGQRAGDEYLASLEALDAAWADAPPGVLTPDQRTDFLRTVGPAVVEFTEQSKHLSDRYQQFADDVLRNTAEKAKRNNQLELVLLGLTLATSLVLFAWLARDVRRKYRSASTAIDRDRADLDEARRSLDRAAAFDRGEASVLEQIITGRTLADVLEQSVVLANSRVDGPRFRLVVGGSLIDPAQFSGVVHLRGGVVPDDLADGEVTEEWDLPVDAGVPAGVLQLVGEARAEDRDEVARVGRRCADLSAVATNRHHAAEQLRYQATHDALTGLVNRADLLGRVKAAMRKDGDGGSLAVLFIDLDRFKLVNDSLGHKSGDQLLVEVADRLRSVVGNDPLFTVSRLGGDEFVILCTGISRVADAEAVADRVAASLVEPVEIDEAEVFVNASIGVAFATPQMDSPEQLLRNADVAMYRAKRSKSGNYVVYNAALEADVAERLETDSALRRAAGRDELRLFLQPVVDMVSLRPVSYEALLRWERPGHGLVGPDDFIPMAEETGIIVELGDWVLRQSVQLLAEHYAATGEELHLAVNVSARQLLEPGFAYRVLSTLFEFNVAPSCLTLELTESSLIELRSSGSVLERLRQSGVRVAMDDFGTGYSSLLQLQTLPIDVVKLDRAFIAGLSAEPGRRHAVLAAATKLVQASGLDLVVEGVETEYEREELLRLDCRLGQGFLFARPAPSADVLARTAASGARAAQGAARAAAPDVAPA